MITVPISVGLVCAVLGAIIWIFEKAAKANKMHQSRQARKDLNRDLNGAPSEAQLPYGLGQEVEPQSAPYDDKF